MNPRKRAPVSGVSGQVTLLDLLTLVWFGMPSFSGAATGSKIAGLLGGVIGVVVCLPLGFGAAWAARSFVRWFVRYAGDPEIAKGPHRLLLNCFWAVFTVGLFAWVFILAAVGDHFANFVVGHTFAPATATWLRQCSTYGIFGEIWAWWWELTQVARLLIMFGTSIPWFLTFYVVNSITFDRLLRIQVSVAPEIWETEGRLGGYRWSPLGARRTQTKERVAQLQKWMSERPAWINEANGVAKLPERMCAFWILMSIAFAPAFYGLCGLGVLSLHWAIGSATGIDLISKCEPITRCP